MFKRVLAGISAALIVGGAAVPASAGSEEDPEVQNPNCGQSTVYVFGEYTVCKAWFEAVSISGEQEPRFRTTIQVLEPVSERITPMRIGISWGRADGCRESWRISDTLDGPQQLQMLRVCSGADTVSLLLPPERVEVDGRNVSLTLTRGDLVSLGSDLAWGDRLSAPVASTRVVILPSNDLAEVSTLGGATEPGRDFVLTGPPEGG